MKKTYTNLLLALFLLLVAGCQDPVMPGFTEDADLHTLSVNGRLKADENIQCPAVIDEAKGLITIQVPYYISDTEPTLGDITQMRVIATMPIGAKFEPALEGLRDMSEGFTSTIHYADGTSKEYKFIAKCVKSSAAEVVKMKVAEDKDVRLVYRVEPEDANGLSIISVAQFGYNHLQTLKSVPLSFTTSPWSTISSNVTEGPVDLTNESLRFTVTAQDGTVRTYAFKIVDPAHVPEGMPGMITPLFGVKVVKGDKYGWEYRQNRTMAVIGDELVIANLKGDFLRHNRFTGAPTGKTVSREGITGDVHGIAHDAAGHLVAVTIGSINNRWIPDHVLNVFVWKDGIEGKPTKIYSLDLQNDPLFAGKDPNANTGRTVGIAGDVLSGKARLGFVFGGLNEFMVLSLKDGKVVKNSGLIKPSVAIALHNASKCIPTGVEDSDPVVIGMLTDRSMIKAEMDGTATKFGPGSHWWSAPRNTKGFAYAKFNGMELVALGNGENASWDANVDWRNRLIVSNIADGTPGALTTGEILDSFNLKYDPNSTATEGNNENKDYARLYGWLNERVGTNPDRGGDACFSISPDGSAMQVYLMVSDMGFMGWEITKYAL